MTTFWDNFMLTLQVSGLENGSAIASSTPTARTD